MEKFVCSDCNKEVQSAESLEQHRQAKHVKQPDQPVSMPKKKLPMKLIVSVLVLIVVIGLLVALKRNHSATTVDQLSGIADPEERQLLNFNLGSMKNEGSLGMHIHPIVKISILGSEHKVPANIGVSATFMHVLHTHDDSGVIHVESPRSFPFRLTDFFIVWGKTFNSTCIFNYCADQTHTLTVTVNGVPNAQYEDIVLKDGDLIKIEYAEKL